MFCCLNYINKWVPVCLAGLPLLVNHWSSLNYARQVTLTATNVEDDTIQTNDKDTTLHMLLSLLVLLELSHQILNVYCIIMTEQEMALAPEQEMALAPEQEMALAPAQEMALVPEQEMA